MSPSNPTPSSVRVQVHDFSMAAEYAELAQGHQAGAVVTFVGRVRDFSDNHEDLWLEHYPGMTEKVLQQLLEQAKTRWPLLGARIVHRVGHLTPGEQIVFVGTSSAHRQAAFDACAYLIDILKTQAPFWKKEGDNWVAAKQSDEQSADQWAKRDQPTA